MGIDVRERIHSVTFARWGFLSTELILMYGVVLILAIGLHEYAHCKFADMAGDPTPGIYGRVTLNLFKHLDPMGSLMILFTMVSGFGIGWGKPAPMNPAKMNNPKWDFFVAVIAGPISNLLQAAVWAVMALFAVRLSYTSAVEIAAALQGQDSTATAIFFSIAVRTNLSLAIFNMIPIGPLDGHWIVKTFLPDPYDLRWERFHRYYGRYILIGLVVFCQLMRREGHSELDIIGQYMWPIVNRSANFLLGNK